MKKIVISFVALCFSLALFAQQTTSQAHFKGFELYGTASTGVFGLNYRPMSGSQLNGPGLRVGVGGGFFMTPKWGISTGVDLSVYSAFSSIKSGSIFAYTAYDSDGLPYTFQTKVDSKIGEQDIMYRIEIPLMIHYRHYLPSGNAIYAAGGLKLSLPMASYFHVSKGTVTTSGTYNNQNVTLTDLPWLNFTTTDYKGTSGMNSSKSTYLASFEVGYLMKLKKTTTYATFSIFGDYGLNNLRYSIEQRSLIYPTLQYGGIFNSTAINQARLISFGVKAAWHINISGEPMSKGKKKTYEQPQKEQEAPSFNRTKGGHLRTGDN